MGFPYDQYQGQLLSSKIDKHKAGSRESVQNRAQSYPHFKPPKVVHFNPHCYHKGLYKYIKQHNYIILIREICVILPC